MGEGTDETQLKTQPPFLILAFHTPSVIFYLVNKFLLCQTKLNQIVFYILYSQVVYSHANRPEVLNISLYIQIQVLKDSLRLLYFSWKILSFTVVKLVVVKEFTKPSFINMPRLATDYNR